MSHRECGWNGCYLRLILIIWKNNWFMGWKGYLGRIVRWVRIMIPCRRYFPDITELTTENIVSYNERLLTGNLIKRHFKSDEVSVSQTLFENLSLFLAQSGHKNDVLRERKARFIDLSIYCRSLQTGMRCQWRFSSGTAFLRYCSLHALIDLWPNR